MKTLQILQASPIGFAHRVSSELQIWNSSQLEDSWAKSKCCKHSEVAMWQRGTGTKSRWSGVAWHEISWWHTRLDYFIIQAYQPCIILCCIFCGMQPSILNESMTCHDVTLSCSPLGLDHRLIILIEQVPCSLQGSIPPWLGHLRSGNLQDVAQPSSHSLHLPRRSAWLQQIVDHCHSLSEQMVDVEFKLHPSTHYGNSLTSKSDKITHFFDSIMIIG